MIDYNTSDTMMFRQGKWQEKREKICCTIYNNKKTAETIQLNKILARIVLEWWWTFFFACFFMLICFVLWMGGIYDWWILRFRLCDIGVSHKLIFFLIVLKALFNYWYWINSIKSSITASGFYVKLAAVLHVFFMYV